jgi:hypothetical protein
LSTLEHHSFIRAINFSMIIIRNISGTLCTHEINCSPPYRVDLELISLTAQCPSDKDSLDIDNLFSTIYFHLHIPAMGDSTEIELAPEALISKFQVNKLLKKSSDQ